MTNNAVYLGLDVGERRIGLALADATVRAAWPLETLLLDDDFGAKLQHIVTDKHITDIVVGKPRNQSGQETAQTTWVKNFAATYVQPLGVPVHWQDESLTSVLAEKRLQERGKPFDKAAIDAEAAAIVLQDFLEART